MRFKVVSSGGALGHPFGPSDIKPVVFSMGKLEGPNDPVQKIKEHLLKILSKDR